MLCDTVEQGVLGFCSSLELTYILDEKQHCNLNNGALVRHR